LRQYIASSHILSRFLLPPFPSPKQGTHLLSLGLEAQGFTARFDNDGFRLHTHSDSPIEKQKYIGALNSIAFIDELVQLLKTIEEHSPHPGTILLFDKRAKEIIYKLWYRQY
jgi:hypothetical protein